MARKRTDYVVVHCSATPPTSDIGVAEIDEMHKARGWDGCGYHAVIRRNGVVEWGRPFDAVGAHCKGHNYQSVGVCLVGGVDKDGNAEDNFTAAQKLSLRYVLMMLRRAYPGAEVLGHRDLSPDVDGDGVVEKHEWMKECPCFEVREWWRCQGH
jgi:N-acetyl-anhydromuramyl-L-alanine amidase AmpD